MNKATTADDEDLKFPAHRYLLALLAEFIGYGLLFWVDWRLGLGAMLIVYGHNLGHHED